jgi:hypothetical protein
VPQPSKTATNTHIVFDICVGTGVDQQLHALRMTIHGGAHKRRRSALKISDSTPPMAAQQQHLSTIDGNM